MSLISATIPIARAILSLSTSLIQAVTKQHMALFTYSDQTWFDPDFLIVVNVIWLVRRKLDWRGKSELRIFGSTKRTRFVMPFHNASEYYQRREHDQRILAEKATNPVVRKVHLDLAERYAEIAHGRVNAQFGVK